MSKEKNNDKEQESNKAEEPETGYQIDSNRKVITISNLEEMKELERTHTAKLSPAQRMEYLRRLNENLFGFDLSRQEKALRNGEIVIREES